MVKTVLHNVFYSFHQQFPSLRKYIKFKCHRLNIELKHNGSLNEIVLSVAKKQAVRRLFDTRE